MRRPLVAVAACVCALGVSPAVDAAAPKTSPIRPVGSVQPEARRTAVALTGFLASPTDQIGVPGALAGGEVTSEGDIYTGWAEYELRFGEHLRAWNQPTRTLPDPGVPLLSSTLSDGPVRYTQTVFAIAVAGRPVAYDTVTASNGSNRPRRVRVAMELAYTRGREIRGAHGLQTGAFRYERPTLGTPVSGDPDGFFSQPGQPFSSLFSYSVSGRDLDRSGLLLARGPRYPSRALSLPAVSTLTGAHDGRVFGALLRAHREVGFTWQIPLDPPAVGTHADRALDSVPLPAARSRLARMWRAQEAGMMQIHVSEPRVSAAYRAAIVQILCSRYRSPSGWVQGSNKLQYQAFWIRDAALQTQALDLVGLHPQAGQDLVFMDRFQQPGGLFISRAQQYDGVGQALWALDRHARLTQSRAYATAQLARMGAAVNWLSWVTAIDPLGLLPAGDPADNELAFGHVTGDDLWAAVGLRSAIDDASLAVRPDLVAGWGALDERFERSLGEAIDAAVARSGHIPPLLDGSGGQDWGNYYAAYPLQVLGASSAAVSSTVNWARAHMVQGLPTYDDGRSLHDYLGFGIFQTELEAGDSADATAGLYAELAHTTATDGGWEWGVSLYGYRGSPSDLAPHATFAADYVALLRNMLVADTPDGGVSLLAGASPAWLTPGQRIAVSGAPTDRGSVSFTERSSTHGERLSWRTSLPPGTELSWTLPRWARGARVGRRRVSGSAIALTIRSGSLTVTFDGHPPAQSYAATVAALNADYRAHGEPAPLVPAAR